MCVLSVFIANIPTLELTLSKCAPDLLNWNFKGPYSNLEFEGEIKFRRRLFKFSIKVMLDD